MQEPHTPPPADGVPPNSYGDVYPGTSGQAQSQPPYTPQSYPPPGYGTPPNAYGQTPYAAAGAPGQGLSDTAAGAIAYLTVIPAIVFLVLAPYNTRPFVKFHAIQCLGIAVAWFCLGIIGIIPILGWILLLVGSLGLVVLWILSIVKASQGSYMKIPVISDFAAQQSGYGLR